MQLCHWWQELVNKPHSGCPNSSSPGRKVLGRCNVGHYHTDFHCHVGRQLCVDILENWEPSNLNIFFSMFNIDSRQWVFSIHLAAKLLCSKYSSISGGTLSSVQSFSWQAQTKSIDIHSGFFNLSLGINYRITTCSRTCSMPALWQCWLNTERMYGWPVLALVYSEYPDTSHSHHFRTTTSAVDFQSCSDLISQACYFPSPSPAMDDWCFNQGARDWNLVRDISVGLTATNWWHGTWARYFGIMLQIQWCGNGDMSMCCMRMYVKEKISCHIMNHYATAYPCNRTVPCRSHILVVYL